MALGLTLAIDNPRGLLAGPAAGPFTRTINLTATPSGGVGPWTFKVDWGDGLSRITAYQSAASLAHTYEHNLGTAAYKCGLGRCRVRVFAKDSTNAVVQKAVTVFNGRGWPALGFWYDTGASGVSPLSYYQNHFGYGMGAHKQNLNAVGPDGSMPLNDLFTAQTKSDITDTGPGGTWSQRHCVPYVTWFACRYKGMGTTAYVSANATWRHFADDLQPLAISLAGINWAAWVDDGAGTITKKLGVANGGSALGTPGAPITPQMFIKYNAMLWYEGVGTGAAPKPEPLIFAFHQEPYNDPPANDDAWAAYRAQHSGVAPYSGAAYTFDGSDFAAAVGNVSTWINAVVQVDGTVGVPNLVALSLGLNKNLVALPLRAQLLKFLGLATTGVNYPNALPVTAWDLYSASLYNKGLSTSSSQWDWPDSGGYIGDMLDYAKAMTWTENGVSFVGRPIMHQEGFCHAAQDGLASNPSSLTARASWILRYRNLAKGATPYVAGTSKFVNAGDIEVIDFNGANPTDGPYLWCKEPGNFPTGSPQAGTAVRYYRIAGDGAGYYREDDMNRTGTDVTADSLTDAAMQAWFNDAKFRPGANPAGAAPTITSFTPSSGIAGTSVVITGTGFTGATAVAFNGVAANFSVDSATQITATAPAGGTGTITVTTSGGTGPSSTSFTVTGTPTIASFTPTSGVVGTSVVITGTNFTGATGAAAVKFNGVNATSYTVDSATQITAVAPTGGSGTIQVTTPAGSITSVASFTVTGAAAPTIGSSGISPTSAAAGASVVITGTNLTGATAVQFNGTDAESYIVDSATQITAVVPHVVIAAGKISVTTPGGTAVSTQTFTKNDNPTITSFTPTSGPLGQSVVITGTHLTGASAVQFNGQNATSFTVNSSTQITAAVPANGGGLIVITTSGGTVTSAASFTLIRPPTITSFAPTSGPIGTSVVITGTNLTGTSGAAGVKFNGVNATSYVVNSDTQITAVVPAGGAGFITVTTVAGTATSTGTYSIPATGPTITGFSPASGLVGASVTINGTNLSGTTLVHFGAGSHAPATAAAGVVTVLVPTGATSAPPQVDTPTGSASAPTSFTVTVAPAPTITSLSVSAGTVGSTFSIVGTNLSNTTAVQVGGIDAAFTIVNSTHVTVTVPAGGNGAIHLDSDDGSADFAGPFLITPEVDSFDPTTGVLGTEVALLGSGFLGATSVTFGGIDAGPVIVDDDSHMRATVPDGGSGALVVTAPGGTTTAPGAFTFIVDSTADYQITYYGLSPGVEHTIEVKAIVTTGDVDKVSGDDPRVGFTPETIGIWLVDDLFATFNQSASRVQLLGQDDLPSAIGESATQFTPVGRRDVVTITDSTRGYEGTISGFVQSRDDLAALEQMKSDAIKGRPVRMVVSDMNIPVLIGAMTIGRVPTQMGFYPVTIAVTQTDEYSINTVP